MTLPRFWTERRLVAAWALAATYIFFLEYLPPIARFQWSGDIGGYHYSLLQYAFQSLKEGRLPEWDPTIYCGLPFAGNVQVGLFYPPNWLLFAANWHRDHLSYETIEGLVFLHFWLAFVLCYIWLRDKRLGKLASILGAGVFTFGGYMVSETQHVGEVMGYAWTPLGLWGIDQAVARRDWRPLWKVAAASALCFLAGFAPHWLAVCVVMTVYAAASPGHWRAALGTLGALGASLLLVMVQLLPAREAAALKTFDPKFGWGFRRVEFFISYFVPNYFDFGHRAYGWGDPSGAYLYLGAPALFGLLWLAWRRNLREHLQALALLGVCLVVLTNPLHLVSGALWHSRLLIQMCHAWNFLAGLSLAAALIAAVSLDDFLGRGTRPAPRWLMPLAIGLLAAWSARQIFVWLPGGDFPARWRGAVEPAVMLALFALGLYAIRGERGRRQAWMAAALLVAVCVDYKVFGTSRAFNNASEDIQTLYPGPSDFPGVDPAVFQKMRSHREFRVAGDEGASPLPPDLRHYGLVTPQGFDPLLPEQYKRTIEATTPFRTDRLFYLDPRNKPLLDLLGVRYFITRASGPSRAALAADPDFRLLEPARSFFMVYEYLKAQPSYRWEGAGGTIERTVWSAGKREFRVGSASGGRFVLVEQYFPGWRATVDGRRTGIGRWGGAFQAVQVPPGEHRVRFEYRSVGLRRGVVISLVALAALALLVRLPLGWAARIPRPAWWNSIASRSRRIGVRLDQILRSLWRRSDIIGTRFWTERRLVAALSLVATCIFFLEYLPPIARFQLFGDIGGYHYPLLQYAFQSLKEGRLPEWDPTIYCGLPFAGNVQAGLFYPPNWLLFAASWHRHHLSYKMLEGVLFLHFWLAFVLCYLWLRDKRLGRLATILGAGVFAFGGYMVSEAHHVGEVMGWAWIPLGLWGIDQAAARRDWRPLWKVAAASALCFLAGFAPAWLAMCVLLVVYAAASPGHWRAALGTLGALAASLLLVMVQLLPAREAAALKTFDPKFGWGIKEPEFYLSYFVPNYFDFGHRAYGWGNPSGAYLYVGVPALFGLLWLAWRRNVRAHLPALAIAGVCLIVLTNPLLLVSKALEHSSLLIQMCHPWCFLGGLSLAAALIAAVSLDDFLGRGQRPAPRWLMPVAIGLLAAWSARQLFLWLPGGAGFPARWRGAIEPAVLLVLFSIGVYVLRAERRSRRAWMAAALLLAVGVDYKVFGTSRAFNNLSGDMDELFAGWRDFPGVDQAVYRQMRSHREFRVAYDEDASPLPTEARHFGLTTPQGFDPLLPGQYKRTIEATTPFRTDRLFYPDPRNKPLLDLLGVRYFITKPDGPSRAALAADPDFRLIEPSRSFFIVYEYLKARPAYRWEGAGPVEREVWSAGEREFRVRSAAGGRFVLVEQYFPGWRATVDGRRVEIERWGGAFQSVRVPPGEHRVRFEYRLASLRWGALMSLASLILLVLRLRWRGAAPRAAAAS